MTLKCNDQIFTLKSQDIFIIDSNIYHNVIDHNETLERLSFRFICNGPDDIPSLPTRFLLYHPIGQEASKIFQTIRLIHKYIENPSGKLSSFRLSLQLQTLLSFIIEFILPEEQIDIPELTLFTSQQNKLSQYIKIERFLGKHFSESITLADLENYLHYSQTQINRILHEYNQMSFTEKLLEIRLQNAKQYLKSTHLPIEEIAEKCGYTTRRGFDSMFIAHTGMTPYTYRKKFTEPSL